MMIVPIVQGYIYSIWNAEFLRQIYPLVMHLPLILILYILTHKLLWPIISVLTAYLCCQLRRWLALFVVALLSGGSVMQDIIELLITLPLLLILLWIAAPVIRKLAYRDKKMQCLFAVIPLMYYVFDYMTMVYTNLLTSGNPVVVEFMPFVCCCAYLMFLLYHSEEEQKRNRLQQEQNILDMQLKQSFLEIKSLHESQNLARQYRHDLRHHLQYVSACIENNQEIQAQKYISEICQNIEAQKVKRYCENETANLILSSFAGKAEKAGIDVTICGVLPCAILIADSDLCMILSNALENAIHACQPLVGTGEKPCIDIQFYEKEGKLFLQIKNPCRNKIRFEKGIPVSDQPNHGIGMQSICAVVDRYKGIYSFQEIDGTFILRIHL